jgi:hypothetical protein
MNMEIPLKARTSIILLVFFQLALGLIYLRTVPRVFNDDAWEMSLGKCLADEGRLRHGIIEGWGGMHIYFIQNQIVQPFVLAGLYHLVGFGLWTSRFASLLMSILAIIAIYKIMTQWFGPQASLLISLMVILNPWFFEISRRVRPEIYYLALAMCALWMFFNSIKNNSSFFSFLTGFFTALAGLSHPTGFVLAGTILLVTFLFLRPRLSKRQILVMVAGLLVPVLLYVIYVVYAMVDPRVNFWEQMRGGKSVIRANVLIVLQNECGRWFHFFQGSKGIGLGILFLIGLIAAFFKSTPYDKTAACIVLLYSFALSVTTVNITSRYLVAMLPFLAALLVRLSQRVFYSASQFNQRYPTIRNLAAGGILAVYILFCTAGISILLYRTHNANFDRVVDRISAITGPKAHIYGPMIFWLGNGKYQYGPFPLDYHWDQTLAMVEPFHFDYAIRTAWTFTESGGIKTPPVRMREFDSRNTLDQICRIYGTKVSDFRDPDFGPVEIYKLFWK